MNSISPNILKLISNYISKNINEKEFNALKQWLNEDEQNKQFFIDHMQIYKQSRRIEFSEILDKDAAWDDILIKIKTPIPQKTKKVKSLKPHFTILKYAAVAILCLSLGYGYLYINQPKTTPIKQDQESNYITLQLEDGNIQILKEDGSTALADKKGNIIGAQQGQQLIYNNKTEKKVLSYNTLNVPYGKRFDVKLSDGTVVRLNAGTSLKYPVHFIKGKKRQVYLNGEAFFNVAKDTAHPFVVNANHLNIAVLGTEFNVSAYPEDNNTAVVLVEGSVNMYKNNQNIKQGTLLVPGTKGTLHKDHLNITTKKVNTLIYTSWKDGGLFFRNMPFKNIVKKLERYYDMKIIITNKALENEIFNAHFKDEPIETVLSYFIDSYDIEYTKTDNIIYIN